MVVLVNELLNMFFITIRFFYIIHFLSKIKVNLNQARKKQDYHLQVINTHCKCSVSVNFILDSIISSILVSRIFSIYESVLHVTEHRVVGK